LGAPAEKASASTEVGIEAELEAHLSELNVQDPFSAKELADLPEEANVHAEYTNIELIELARGEVEDEELNDDSSGDIEEMAIDISIEEKLATISSVLAWTDDGGKAFYSAVQKLRRIRCVLKDALTFAKCAALSQADLRSYFKRHWLINKRSIPH